MTTAVPGTALAVLAAASFGAAMVFTKVGLRYMGAAAGALVSIPSTALLYWVLAVFLLDTAGWSAAAVAIFAAVGLFFPAAVTLLLFESNRRMGPTAAGTASCTSPLFAALGAILFVGETLTWPVAIGTGAVVCGVMVLSTQKNEEQRGWPRWVLILPLSAAAIRGLAQAVTKIGLTLWANPFAAGLIGYTVSSATVLAANRVLARGEPLLLHRRGVPWFMLAGLCNGAAVLAMYVALSQGRVTLVSPIVATYPLFTLLFSAAFLREESIDLRIVLGVLLTVAGVGVLVVG